MPPAVCSRARNRDSAWAYIFARCASVLIPQPKFDFYLTLHTFVHIKTKVQKNILSILLVLNMESN